jgi:hypothetical protein
MPDDAPPLTYGQLRATHPSYHAKRMARIEDLYEGGWVIMEKAGTYLPQLPLEHSKHYEARCETASYQPYFGQIVDQFVSDLFSQPLTISAAGDAENPQTPGEVPDKEFYTQLAKDIDGEGTQLEDLAADVLTTALKHRLAYVMVDAPDASEGPAPANLADEDAAGLRRCYAYEVPPAQVIDWKRDKKTGAFEWVILATREQDRSAPSSGRSQVTETFTVWNVESGKARWTRYVVTYPQDKAPTDEQLVSADASGDSSFDRIPLLLFELPKGLWVGNKIGPQALEHWRRRSQLIGAEGRSCVAIPYVALGPELPAPGQSTSEAADNPHRGRDPVKQFEKQGFLQLGHQDKLDFAEPHGHSYEIIDKQIDSVRENMYAVNHQMAAGIRPTSGALGRSGLSKQKDEDKTSKVLGALGRTVRTFFVCLYDTISQGRGEDVIWVAHGLDSYETDDREQVLNESLQVKDVAESIPSPTFSKEHAKRIVKKLVPNLPPDTVAQIFDEIDRGIDEQQEVRDLEHEARKESIKNPPLPVIPGVVAGPVQSNGVSSPKPPSQKPKPASPAP